MTLAEMKKKVFELIEEIDTTNSSLTADPDLAAKINSVINQKQYELSRFKKIPEYTEIDVKNGDLLEFSDIDKNVYQLENISGVDFDLKADGSKIKCLEDGVLEISYFKYPKLITESTDDSYKFELSADILEIMPYGVAADLLASDVSSGYGNIYRNIYEQMIQRLDSRFTMAQIVLGSGDDYNGIL